MQFKFETLQVNDLISFFLTRFVDLAVDLPLALLPVCVGGDAHVHEDVDGVAHVDVEVGGRAVRVEGAAVRDVHLGAELGL